MRTRANRYEASVMKTASCSPSSIQSCSSTRSLISTAGLAASYATQHCASTCATISSSLRVTVHHHLCFLISAGSTHNHTQRSKKRPRSIRRCAASCSRIIFSFWLNTCTAAPLHIIMPTHLHMADDLSRSICLRCSWISTITVVVGCTIKPPSLIAAEVPLWVIL
jgi:hypothetical protein